MTKTSMIKPMPSLEQVHYTRRVLDISCPPTQPFSGSSNPPPARFSDPSLRTMAAYIPDPLTHPISTSDLKTSSELCTLNSIKYMLHLRDVLTYVPDALTAPQLVVPQGQRGIMLTHAQDCTMRRTPRCQCHL